MQRRSTSNYAPNPLPPLSPLAGATAVSPFDARPYLVVVLVIAAAARLIALGAPLLDFWAGEQVTAASIARNFARSGYNLLEPVTDWGSTPGMGLPLYHWLVALLYGPLQVNEWLGRLVSVVASVAAVLLLYRIVARLTGTLTALYAAFFLAICPLAIYLGRSFLPDSFNLALALAAIYAFLDWSDMAAGDRPLRGQLLAVGLATLCAALAVLTDAGNILLIVPLGYAAMVNLRELAGPKRRSYGLTFAAYLLIVAGLAWLRGGASLTLTLAPDGVPGLLGALLGLVLTIPGLFLLVIGLSRHARRPLRWFVHLWLAAGLLYLLLNSGGGNSERLLLFAPAAAAVIGMGTAQLAAWVQMLFDYMADRDEKPQRAPGQVSPSLAVAALGLYLLIAKLGYDQIAPLYSYADLAPSQEIARQVKAVVPGGQQVLITSPNFREILYYADRKGRSVPPTELASLKPDSLKQPAGSPISHLVTNVGDARLPADFFASAVGSYKLVAANRLVAIFDLQKIGDPTAILIPQTGVSLSGPLRRYWEATGAEGLFGFPITEPQDDNSGPAAMQVQWFERARLEYHPELAGQEGEITLGRIGREATVGKSFNPPPADQRNNTSDRAYFAETDHTLSGTFLIYWREGGGLGVFGYPISEQVYAVITPGKVTRVQWFERARMECVADGPNECASINLGLLGREMTGIR